MRLRTFLSWLALGLALIGLGLVPARAQQAESRFAFVIGNDGYEQAELPTAANDAALVADALRTAGFDVTGARNLDQDTFRSSYREFLAKVSAAGPSAVAAIYISGYGLQLEGENFFVPIGARIIREGDIGFNAIRISDLLRPLAGLNGKASLVMLDLAHDNPFAKEGQPLAPGLAIIDVEPNMLVSMNAAPGMVGPKGGLPYGAYAQALAEMLRSAGASTDEIFDRVRLRVAELSKNQQVPWSVSKLQPPLVLLDRGPDAPPPAVEETKLAAISTGAIKDLGPDRGYAAVLKRDRIPDYAEYVETYPQSPYAKNVRGILAARREATIWARTTALNTPNAYWSYLKRYPRGPHAADARRRLNRLTAPVEPPPQFDLVEYDVPPPPPEESVYFEGRPPVYIEDVPPPMEVVEIAPPPRWWTPPPPPQFDDDSDYFLPAPVGIAPPPPWVAPPVYVADPIMPPPQPGIGLSPYIAIPAALAAGIAAGKLLSNKKNFPQPGGAAPFQPPQVFKPTVMPPVSLPAGQTHSNTGRRPPPPGVIGMPPISQPPVVPTRPPVPPVQPQGGMQGIPTQPVRPPTPPTPFGQSTQPQGGMQGLPTQPVRPPTPPVTQPQGGMQGLPTQPVRPPTPPVPQPQGGMQGLPTQPVRPPTPPVTQPQGGMQGLPTQPVRPPTPPAPFGQSTQPQGGMQALPTQPVRPPTPPVTQPQGGMQGLPTQPVRPPTPPVTQPQGGMQGLPTQPVRPPTPPVTQPQGGMQGLPTQPVRPPTPPVTQPAPFGQGAQQQQQLQQQQMLQQQQRQQAEQARQQQLLQQQRQQQMLQQQQQQQQQQRQQAEQARQQQLQQQQRQQAEQARQQQLQQQQRQQQMIQQQQQQQRQQQILQQQRQQQIQQQQRQQQIQQQQRQQQMIQQQQQQQRQQQILQQQRQQQMIQQQQQQRQQQMLQQQRQQQMIQQQQQQQRQQQMLQQQRQQQQQQQQRRPCGGPFQPPCR